MKLFNRFRPAPRPSVGQIRAAKKPAQDTQAETIAKMDRDIKFLKTKLNTLTKVKCYHCGRVLVPNMNPIYTNFEGKKFCSHECIDAAKQKPATRSRKGKKK